MNTTKKYRYLSLLIFLSLLLSSCNLFEEDAFNVIAGKKDVYAGIYTQGIEDSSFKPCIAEDEVWRFSEFPDTAFQRIIDFNKNPVYLELRGIPSERGEYKGFFVTYDRKFKVENLVAIKNPEKKGC